MRKKDVEIGGVYVVKVSDKLTTVKITSERYGGSGWVGINEKTGRTVRIRTAGRLRAKVLDAPKALDTSRPEVRELYDAVRVDTISDEDYDAMAKAVEARERAASRSREFAASLMTAPGVPSFIDGESADDREERLIAAAKDHPLTAKWCDCGVDTGFRCYPGDGECRCGVHKHHVHGTCGHVVQVG